MARTCLNPCVPCTIEFQSSRSLPTILLLRVFLSRLGGKHRQLARQVGDSASSSASSMATFAFSTMTPPRGATFIFGSWVCVANGSGGFDSHLTNSPMPKSSTSEDSNKSHDHGVTLLPDLAKEIEPKLENNSSSTRTQIDLKLKFTRIGTLMKIAWIAYFTLKTNQPLLAWRHPFLTSIQIQSSHLKTAWILSPMCWQRSNSRPAKVIHSQNYSITFEKLPALMISHFKTVFPS